MGSSAHAVTLLRMEKELYTSPLMEIYEIMTEGVLCSSSGNEGVGEEEGIGSFN